MFRAFLARMTLATDESRMSTVEYSIVYFYCLTVPMCILTFGGTRTSIRGTHGRTRRQALFSKDSRLLTADADRAAQEKLSG